MNLKIVRLLALIAGFCALWTLTFTRLLGATLPDALLSFSGAGFSVALIPAIISNYFRKTAMALSSALTTFVLLIVMIPGVVMFGAWYSVGTTVLTAFAWLVLTLQAMRYSKGSTGRGG